MPLSCLQRILIFHWHQKGCNDTCTEVSDPLKVSAPTAPDWLETQAINKSENECLSALLAPGKPRGALSVGAEQDHRVCPIKDVHVEKLCRLEWMPALKSSDQSLKWTEAENTEQELGSTTDGGGFSHYGRTATAMWWCWETSQQAENMLVLALGYGRPSQSIMPKTSELIPCEAWVVTGNEDRNSHNLWYALIYTKSGSINITEHAGIGTESHVLKARLFPRVLLQFSCWLEVDHEVDGTCHHYFTLLFCVCAENHLQCETVQDIAKQSQPNTLGMLLGWKSSLEDGQMDTGDKRVMPTKCVYTHSPLHAGISVIK